QLTEEQESTLAGLGFKKTTTRVPSTAPRGLVDVEQWIMNDSRKNYILTVRYFTNQVHQVRLFDLNDELDVSTTLDKLVDTLEEYIK
ncbi:hypothetical protein CEW46_32860, partial [Bacillus cereus]